MMDADVRDTLYVSDMDGTLLGADSRLPEKTRILLNEAISAGCNFTVATARTPATVAPLLGGLDLRLPAVVMTGAAIWHRAEGRYSHVCPIAADEAGRLLEIYSRHGLPTFVYTLREGIIEVYHTGPMTGREDAFVAERLHTPYKHFNIPPSGVSEPPYTDGDVLLLFAMRPSDQVEAVWRELKAAGGCTPVFYHDMYGPETGMMEVFSPSASKAEAVKRLAADLGLRRIVAFGDNVNDIPMLRAADVAVAVENAVPEVKAIADVVIGKNTEDSVARYISASILRQHHGKYL